MMGWKSSPLARKLTSMKSPPVRGEKVATQNPLKVLRKRAGRTIDQVAARAEVSRQFVIRSEQGVYSEPPASLLGFYSSILDVSVAQVTNDYFNFQRATRQANYGRLIEPWAFTAVGAVGEHPFTRWRLMSGISSAAGVCKLFCVHPASLNKFEKHPEQCAVVPDQLAKALLESGYKASTLADLESAYLEHKRKMRQLVEVVLGD